MPQRFYHEPVLVGEVLAALRVTAGKRYIDATIGGGGHGWEMVKRGGIVLGLDVDKDALDFVRQKHEIRDTKYEKQMKLVHGNFRKVEEIAKREGFDQVDGILFDLGVSSHQLDTPRRGFSYRFKDAPLDLRMSKEGETAEQLLRRVSEGQLYEILAKYGEVDRAREFARAIKISRPVTTGDLLVIVGERLGPQVFQALRIAVNDELTALKEALVGAGRLLAPNGRLAVISFHSLEDRIVKIEFRKPDWNVITKKPVTPSAEEVAQNRRARSAKLRVAQNLQHETI